VPLSRYRSAGQRGIQGLTRSTTATPPGTRNSPIQAPATSGSPARSSRPRSKGCSTKRAPRRSFWSATLRAAESSLSTYINNMGGADKGRNSSGCSSNHGHRHRRTGRAAVAADPWAGWSSASAKRDRTSLYQQALGSPFQQEVYGNGDTRPGRAVHHDSRPVNDWVVTPYTQQALNGPNVTTSVLQDLYQDCPRPREIFLSPQVCRGARRAGEQPGSQPATWLRAPSRPDAGTSVLEQVRRDRRLGVGGSLCLALRSAIDRRRRIRLPRHFVIVARQAGPTPQGCLRCSTRSRPPRRGDRAPFAEDETARAQPWPPRLPRPSPNGAGSRRRSWQPVGGGPHLAAHPPLFQRQPGCSCAPILVSSAPMASPCAPHGRSPAPRGLGADTQPPRSTDERERRLPAGN